MNSDDLALFARVARAGGISRAAMETGTNQSTVSRRIAALESEHGVRLFRRSGRGVAVTEQGALLLDYALNVEKVLEEASRKLRDRSALGPARLCIAAQPTIARIMFGAIGHALKARYPTTQVRFVEGLASQLLQMLQQGEVDVAIMYIPEHRGTLQYDLLLTVGVCLVTPNDYPLLGISDHTIDVRALKGLPLILPSTHHGLRLLVESLGARLEFTPTIALECDGSISILKRLVLANCGCTILPSAAVVEEVAAGRLKCYRLAGPAVTRDVGIVWPLSSTNAESVWHVSQIIRQCAGDLVRDGAWPDTKLADVKPSLNALPA